jgi:hypothetical protein
MACGAAPGGGLESSWWCLFRAGRLAGGVASWGVFLFPSFFPLPARAPRQGATKADRCTGDLGPTGEPCSTANPVGLTRGVRLGLPIKTFESRGKEVAAPGAFTTCVVVEEEGWALTGTAAAGEGSARSPLASSPLGALKPGLPETGGTAAGAALLLELPEGFGWLRPALGLRTRPEAHRGRGGT